MLFKPGTYFLCMMIGNIALTINDITRLKNSGPDKWQQLERFMPALTNVFDIYEKAKISAKINLVKGVFKHNLVYSEGAFRTPSISEAFAYNSLKAKEKWLLFVEQPLVFSRQNPFSSP